MIEKKNQLRSVAIQNQIHLKKSALHTIMIIDDICRITERSFKRIS